VDKLVSVHVADCDTRIQDFSDLCIPLRFNLAIVDFSAEGCSEDLSSCGKIKAFRDYRGHTLRWKYRGFVAEDKVNAHIEIRILLCQGYGLLGCLPACKKGSAGEQTVLKTVMDTLVDSRSQPKIIPMKNDSHNTF